MPHFFFVLLMTVTSFAWAEQTMEPTRDQALQIEEHNARTVMPNTTLAVTKPYVEYDKARFLLINDSFSFGSGAAKVGILANLPSDMVALVLTTAGTDVKSVEARFAPYLSPSRFRVLSIPGGSGFWVRDTTPVPVYVGNGASAAAALAGARYWGGVRPGPTVSKLLRLPFHEHSFFYEGGNFVADRKGTCLAVNHRIGSISDEVFRSYYGCAKLIRLPYRAGIGHVDERVKFVSDAAVVTDEPTYVETLKNLGYTVHLLPRPRTSLGTYVNALHINGTLFMPAYREAGDAQAAAVYRSFGLKVIPLDSISLSSSGKGSLHCITMVYPDGTLNALWNSLRNSLDLKDRLK